MNLPRIYTYKVTFEEVPYYYYGVHKEKVFNEYYFGSPITHKWAWNFYTPKKQILETFEYSEDGWKKANDVEYRLIKSAYNIDKWCLNENCGGAPSLNLLKLGGQKVYELGLGIHGLSEDELSEFRKLGGQKVYELGLGIHGLSEDQLSEAGKLGGQKAYELGLGIHGLSEDQLSEFRKLGGQKAYELGLGIHGLSKDQLNEAGKLGGKTVSTQKWQCTVTGHISNPGALTNYQKARQIDTFNRVKV